MEPVGIVIFGMVWLIAIAALFITAGRRNKRNFLISLFMVGMLLAITSAIGILSQ
jgi:hypothetical protein